MFEAKLNKKQQTSVMESFWAMMMALESEADVEGKPLEKHFVEAYFRQWNEVMKDNKQPAWIRRASAMTDKLLAESNARTE